ncbi:MAG: laminin G domain-containing protein [Candidatus Aenigmarchaeota archaeon]|nr:laminin G domain-containing protein [Candidatus Aenigmarchaeota archaeon]
MKAPRSLRCKGVSSAITAIVLVMLTVIVMGIISSWITATSAERTRSAVNFSQSKFACQRAEMYVSNVSFDCGGSCFTGVPYSINATIENSGTAGVNIGNIFLTMNDGIAYKTDGNTSTLASGDIETKRFNAIQIFSSPKMPTETMNTRKAYSNDSNTTGLWHFDDGTGNSATDSARGNTGTLQNGTTACNGAAAQCPVWNSSGKFGYAISFDGINDFVSMSATSFSNTTATVEAHVEFDRNTSSDNFTIIATPSQISNTHAGLVGLWHFEENSTASGGVKDGSTYGNNGTATGSPYFNTSGRFGSTWTMDGINDYIDIGSQSSLTFASRSFSVSAWVRLNGLANDGVDEGIVADYRGSDARWILLKFRNANGVFQFGLDTNGAWAPERTAESITIPVVDMWYYVVGTYDHSTGDIKIYVNGVFEKVSTGSPLSIGAVNDVTIGNWYNLVSRPTDGVAPVNGTIDEVAIYNRSLSEAEVRDLYLGGLSLHKYGDQLRFVAGNATLAYNVSGWSGWHHVAGAYDSSTAALYADGDIVNTTVARGIVKLGTSSFVGGMYNSSKNLTLIGTVDEVRVSNITRNFTATLNYTVSYPNIRYVRLYNQSGQLENVSDVGSAGAGSFSAARSVNTGAQGRREVQRDVGAGEDKLFGG